ncbi:MAG: NAD-dependent epimerase/dehydratase family protein [Clostridiales bacterium]|nr:NAD-dependent epimerase/dehydratase family protein [Clostridiales bacterium]
MMKKVLIIGKNSYIAKNFICYSSNKEYSGVEIDGVSASNGEWKEKGFEGYHTVLFLAGKVHQKETEENKKEYDAVNYQLALEIAKKSQESNVSQFIYMSTAAVYGDAGQEKGEVIIDENSPCIPKTAYGISKRKAEVALLKLEEEQEEKKMKVCIVRPPMVYGKECPGNFMKLYHLALKIPIFPLMHNQRSMIAIDNLCEFLYQVMIQEKGGIYHPQDIEYVETSKLVGYMRKANGKGILYVKKLNPLISTVVKTVGTAEKVFGNYVYVKSISRYDRMEYQVVDIRKVLKEIVREKS